jgi:adenylate cyclase
MSSPIQFSDFILDPRKFELRQGTRIHKLEKIPMELLLLLVQKGGDLVSRDEIVERLWGKDVFLEADRGINTAMSKIRMALCDDPQKPKYIQTVVGKGYRFIAKSSQLPSAEAGAEPVPASVIAAPNTQQAPCSLAVLPFEDMSPGRDEEYLCAGIAEELINVLTQIDGLRVAARMASFQFRSPGADVRSIGRDLRVQVLLEGSVRKSGDRLRITVQLVDVESGFHRWSRLSIASWPTSSLSRMRSPRA